GEGRVRKGMTLLSLGLGACAIGQSLSVLEPVFQPDPRFSTAAYLSAIPLSVVGIVVLSGAARLLVNARTALDLLGFSLATAAIIWHEVAHPLFGVGDWDGSQKLVAMAYLFGEVTLTSLALAATQRFWK